MGRHMGLRGFQALFGLARQIPCKLETLNPASYSSLQNEGDPHVML